MGSNPPVMLGAPECYSIPAANAELYIRTDPTPEEFDVGTAQWLRIRGLDSFTESFPTNTTDQSSEGWIRSMVTQAGYTVTATGKRSTTDPGQAAVNELIFSWIVGCGRQRAFRFRVRGSHEEDPDATDVSFWSTPTLQDSSVSGTDDFTWGIELIAYQPPVDSSGAPLVEQQATPVTRGGGAQPAAQGSTQQSRAQRTGTTATAEAA